jgi:O-antigen/teichoic acid export membrane protein
MGVDERSAYGARLERLHWWMAAAAIGLALAAEPMGGVVLMGALAGAAFALRAGADLHRRFAYLDRSPPTALAIDAAANGPLVAYALLVLAGWISAGCASALIVAAFGGLLGWTVGVLRHQGWIGAPPISVREALRHHVRRGGWLVGATLASWGANQLYPFLVAGALGLEATGILAACRSLIGVTQIPLQTLDAQGLPAARRSFVDGGRGSLVRVMARIALVVAGTVGLACIAVIVFPDLALRIGFGDRYHGAAAPMRWIAAQQILIAAGYLLNIGLLAIDEPRCGFWSRLGACVATVTLGPLMIHLWGVAGACAAMFINSLAIVAVGGWWFLRRLRNPRGKEAT